MNSYITQRFWKHFARLPEPIQRRAKDAYTKFKNNPYHPSLCFKRIHSSRAIYAVRITQEYRAIGTLLDHEIIWFWIGSHSDYNTLLKQIKSS